MEQTLPRAAVSDLPAHLGGLPHDRSRWPDDARRAFRELLRDLERWCRHHDRPTATNEWVAEQAIRQCW